MREYNVVMSKEDKIQVQSPVFELNVELSINNTREFLCIGESLIDFEPDKIVQIGVGKTYNGISVESNTVFSSVADFFRVLKTHSVRLESIRLSISGNNSLSKVGGYVSEILVGNIEGYNLLNTRMYFSNNQFQDNRIDMNMLKGFVFDKESFIAIPIPKNKDLSFCLAFYYSVLTNESNN